MYVISKYCRSKIKSTEMNSCNSKDYHVNWDTVNGNVKDVKDQMKTLSHYYPISSPSELNRNHFTNDPRRFASQSFWDPTRENAQINNFFLETEDKVWVLTFVN